MTKLFVFDIRFYSSLKNVTEPVDFCVDPAPALPVAPVVQNFAPTILTVQYTVYFDVFHSSNKFSCFFLIYESAFHSSNFFYLNNLVQIWFD
jgi:hypothetical protein